MSKPELCILFAVVLTLLTACAPKQQFLALEPGEELELVDTPFFSQREYQCGPASLAMILGAADVKIHPDELVPLTYLPGRQGSLQLELISASRRHHRIPYVIEPELSALISELRGGNPVLVLQNYGLESLPAYHYAVVIGVQSDKIILRSGTNRRVEMDITSFLMSWKRTGSWGFIVLNPGELPVRADVNRYLKAVAAFEASGHTQQAKDAYLAALSRWPGHQGTMFALGNNQLARGNMTMAEAQYRKIVEKDPNHIAAANNLAETLARRGCYPEAAAVIGRAADSAIKLGSPLKDIISQTSQEILSQLRESTRQKRHISDYSDKKIHEIVCSKK